MEHQAAEEEEHQIPQAPPFVIDGLSVPHIGDKVFSLLDDKDLMKCRAVSKAFKDYVDTKTPLWSKKSLMEAVNDEELDETVRLEIVKKILESKAKEWNIIKQKMARAVEDDRLDTVKELTKKLADETDINGKTSLHRAAKRGQTDVCRAILNSHVHVTNSVDGWGETPLHIAAAEGHTETCSHLGCC